MSILRFLRRWRDAHRMSCAEVGAVLQQYLDDELDDTMVPLVRAHLEMCRRCGLEASVYRDVKDALAGRGEPSEESLERLREFGHRVAHGQVPLDGV